MWKTYREESLHCQCDVESSMEPTWLLYLWNRCCDVQHWVEKTACVSCTPKSTKSKKVNSGIKRSKQGQRNTQLWPVRTVNDCEKTNTHNTCNTAFTAQSVNSRTRLLCLCHDLLKATFASKSVYTEHCIMTGWYDIYSAHVIPPRHHSMDSAWWQEQLVALHLDNMVASYDQKGVVKGYYLPFSAYLGLWPAVWTCDFVRNFFVSATSRNEWNHVGNNVAIAMQCGTLHETNLAGCV